MWHLCQSFATSTAASVTDLTDKSFLSSLLAPLPKRGSGHSFASESSGQHEPKPSSEGSTSSSSGNTSTTVYGRPEESDSGCKHGSPEVTMLKGALVDAKKFLQSHSLSGIKLKTKL